MKYIEICYPDQLHQRLDSLAKARVRRIPLEKTRKGTQYWIDEYAKVVFVAHLICGRFFIDRVRIYEAGYRSKNAKPCFKYRKDNNVQVTCALDKAVYGAFILKNRMPDSRSVFLRNFDLSNCSVQNLVTYSEEMLIIKSNMSQFAQIYLKNYKKMVEYCAAEFGRSQMEAEDIVSEAFLTMCKSIKKIRNPCGVWVWRIVKVQFYRIYRQFYIPLDRLKEIGIEI